MFSYENIVTGILFLPALYTCKKLYQTYITLKQQYRDEQLFNEKHNCVIMYSPGEMRGWPPEFHIKSDKNNMNRFLEPYIFFIKTAKFSLNIAMMRIGMNPLFDALHEAVERGVKIKLIVNFQSVQGGPEEKFKKLSKAGVKIAYFVDKSEQLNNIMHCKYMVKDYNTTSGYLCMGSLNFAGLSTLLKNYEDVTFTSHISVVEAFDGAFKHSWNIINEENKNLYNKTVLDECGLLE